MPVVPLNQPIHNVALKKGVGGCAFWFHRQPKLPVIDQGIGRTGAGRARRTGWISLISH
jgi:hypothetical protein